MSRHGWLLRSLTRLPATLLLLLAGACTVQQGNVQRAPENAPVIETSPQPGATNAPPAAPGSVQPPLITRPLPPPPGGFPKSLAESGASPAVQSLARQAQEARSGGKNDVALGALERALHIEPRNPFVWQALADAQLALGHAGDAEAAAHKSSSLARGNPYLEAGNWRLIAAARAALGDGAGARLANARADSLNGAPAQIQ